MRVSFYVACVALLLFVLPACGLWDVDSWNQKVIIELETPGGPAQAFSVQAVQLSRPNFSSPIGSDVKFSVSGEAVVVDLGRAGMLFALLKGTQHHGDAGRLAPVAFWGLNKPPGYGSTTAINHLLSLPIGSRAALPPEAYPMLVTFRDINDPQSAVLVDPRDVAAVLGPGYALTSIDVELTSDAATDGRVKKALLWLDDPKVNDNPGWQSLPALSQTAIYYLRSSDRKK